jgi:hypothetical protein
MLHVSRQPGGGVVVGGGIGGRAIWFRRDPYCHRWSVWRTRLPQLGPFGGYGDEPGSAGVREPRRPQPSDSGSTAAIDLGQASLGVP